MWSQPAKVGFSNSYIRKGGQDLRHGSKLLPINLLCAKIGDCMRYSVEIKLRLPRNTYKVGLGSIVVLGADLAEVGSSAVELPQRGPSILCLCCSQLRSILCLCRCQLCSILCLYCSLLQSAVCLYHSQMCSILCLCLSQLLCTLPGPLNNAIGRSNRS